MDPYLEHPRLWDGVHARTVVAIANRLQPLLDPRHVATVEERVCIEGPQRRIPDVWIQRVREGQAPVAVAEPRSSSAVIVEVEPLDEHQLRIEIVDACNEMRLAAVIELHCPTNKAPAPGLDSYIQKQHEIPDRDCHLVEIDLLRRGQHVLAAPEWKLDELREHADLVCVSRWPNRNRYERDPTPLREALPEIAIPLVDPDADVHLPLLQVLTPVYDDGRHARRLRYAEPCNPPLSHDEQKWADEILASVRNSLNNENDQLS